MELKHISEKELTTFRSGQMTGQETEAFLSHISSCDFCSGLFADSMENDLVSAPQNLKLNLMNAVRRPEMRMKRKAREASRRMQLFLYSLKVGTAMAGALLVLFLSISLSGRQSPSSDTNPEHPKTDSSITSVIRDNLNSLSSSLSKFSDQILNTEVNRNEKKEK